MDSEKPLLLRQASVTPNVNHHRWTPSPSSFCSKSVIERFRFINRDQKIGDQNLSNNPKKPVEALLLLPVTISLESIEALLLLPVTISFSGDFSSR
ncbi:hypothetical protein L2E82_47656 [Cichorium intybus]|uniref:Uncharacterized protein n=1 Tax=Cichorium intybus TaxID=13427 RepID=A0ACB8YW79_CICIN|nr:hypothetical protein L2E82_47656 [Cichorium intybus]